MRPDGSSRKLDHDRVDRILNRVIDDLYAEIARRFDPTIDDTNAPGTIDEAAIFQLLAGWREVAWRNAELLATADSAGARATVAATIEAYAASQADLIRVTMAYGPLRSSAARDAYCAVNHG